MHSSKSHAAASPPEISLILSPPYDNDNFIKKVSASNATNFPAASKSKIAMSSTNGQDYVEPTDDDVLRGRGGGVNSNSGKQRLFDLIRPLRKVYVTLERGEKYKLSKQVVDEVHGWGGRFLEMEKDDFGRKLYYEMSLVAAVKLVEQKFRDDPMKRKTKSKKSSRKVKRTQTRNDDDEDGGESGFEVELNGDEVSVESITKEQLSTLESAPIASIDTLVASKAVSDSAQYSPVPTFAGNVSYQNLAHEIEGGLSSKPVVSVDVVAVPKDPRDEKSLDGDVFCDSFRCDTVLANNDFMDSEFDEVAPYNVLRRSFCWETILGALPPFDLSFDKNDLDELYQGEVME